MVRQQAPQLQAVAQALRANNFQVVLASSAQEACRTILELVPQPAAVGIGDSASVRQLGVLAELEKRGNTMVNPFIPELTSDKSKHGLLLEQLRRSLSCDVFLAGTNAVTVDGKLVNIDRTGNRVAGLTFGPPRVVVVVGRNKIVPDVASALDRIKNVIAPAHASWRNRHTPCATTGRCTDCQAQERLCNITSILEKKPLFSDFHVVLVDEDLGLGWDPAWPRDRIDRIRKGYQQVTWAWPAPQGQVR